MKYSNLYAGTVDCLSHIYLLVKTHGHCDASVRETFSLSYILLKCYYAHLEIIHEQIDFCGEHIRISVFLNMHLLAGNAEVL